MSHSQFHSINCLYLDMHGLIFETSIWLLAGSTRFLSYSTILCKTAGRIMRCFYTGTEYPSFMTAWPRQINQVQAHSRTNKITQSLFQTTVLLFPFTPRTAVSRNAQHNRWELNVKTCKWTFSRPFSQVLWFQFYPPGINLLSIFPSERSQWTPIQCNHCPSRCSAVNS